MKKQKKYFDHQGNEFSCINEMCDAWGITKTTFAARKNRGWKLKKILETKDELYELDNSLFPNIQPENCDKSPEECPKVLVDILRKINAYDFFKAVDSVINKDTV